MSCLKGKDKAEKEEARFVCEKCGALAEKKQQACKPVKLEEKKKKKKKDKKDKKK